MIGWLLLQIQLVSFASNPLDQWQWRNPLPDSGNALTANGLWGVTFANGTFVAVGNQGTIVSSVDGTNWTSQTLGPIYGPGTWYSLWAVAWGNGLWVGVGTGGPNPGDINVGVNFPVVVTSPDLVNWKTQAVPADVSYLMGIIYTNGLFVTVGGAYDPLYQDTFGVVATSPDGANWTLQNSGTSDTLGDIIYGNGLFVANSWWATIITSPDATNWTEYAAEVFSGGPNGRWMPWNAPAFSSSDMVCADGLYLLCGGFGDGILCSPDGINWTNLVATNNASCITYNNEMVLAIGDQISTSTNGMNWKSRGKWAGAGVNALCYGNGTFVAVGIGLLAVSTDGIHWTHRDQASSVTTSALQAAAYGGGTFVAVGENGTIVSSQDGAQWSAASSSAGNSTLWAVAYGGGSFAAVGDGGLILSSQDGVDWTAASPVETNSLSGVAYGDGLFVAVGSTGVTLTSTNDSLWALEDSGIRNDLQGLAYGGGLFVAGAGDEFLTSPDGAVWTVENFEPGTNVAGLAYGNGVFAAVGDSGLILISSDGVNWATNSSGTSADLYSVTYGGGTFLITGSSGVLLSSTNGADWVSRNSTTDNNLWGAAFGQNTFIVVGDSGTILQSGALFLLGAQLSPVPGWTNGAFILSLSAPVGGQWEIQGSTDFQNWTPLGMITITNTPMPFIDTGATKFSQRFYRAVSP
jgi:hypothetical protein